MTGSVVLDVIIGLVFIYLIYSLLASIIQEIIATNFSFRAKILERAIVRMLEDENKQMAVFQRLKGYLGLFLPISKSSGLSKDFYDHPLIKYLGEDKWHNKPPYIDRGNFSKVMIDLLRGEQIKPDEDWRPYIESTLGFDHGDEEKLTGSNTMAYLRSLWVDARGDVEVFRNELENWFDDMMQHATGWYKQYNQVILLMIGLTLAIIFNVDSIEIAKKLSKDPELRAEIIQQASSFQKNHPNLEEEYKLKKVQVMSSEIDSLEKKGLNNDLDTEYTRLKHRRDSLEDLAYDLLNNEIKNANSALGLGWVDTCETDSSCNDCGWVPSGENGPFTRFFGWLLTALAISLGAPFWFDLLNKLMKLRGAVQSQPGKGTIPQQNQANISPSIKRVG